MISPGKNLDDRYNGNTALCTVMYELEFSYNVLMKLKFHTVNTLRCRLYS
jgi:hypothetical protein